MKKWDKRTRTWRQHTTYTIWYQVVKRCTDPTHHSYDSYGGRGIKVQEDWVPNPQQSRPSAVAYRNFIRDVGLRPNQSLSLDRIDPNSHYIKENVRWANSTTQGRNKRQTVYITDPEPPYQIIPVAELAERWELRYQTLRYRLKKAGLWPGDEIPSESQLVAAEVEAEIAEAEMEEEEEEEEQDARDRSTQETPTDNP